MKTRFTWLGVVAACILGICTVFSSCEKEENAIVKYIGKVVYAGTANPFAELEVKVTNGDKIHDLSHTDANGAFSLTVKVADIDGSYYVLVGDSSCVTKRMELSGYGQAQVDLGTIEIEGPKLPTVTTKPITDISDNKATSGGNVTADGRAKVTARGVCWSKKEYPTIEDEHTQNGSGIGEFKSQLTNLEAGATYYVRAYATNRVGTAYGQQLTLSSLTGLPQVTTDEVSNISATSATCGGDVAANSGYAISARGICWSNKSATPTINNDHTEEVATTGHFTSMMIGLERNTTYYVRAYAVNEKGANYGEAKTFTTLTGLPEVSTAEVTNIKATTASCGGAVTSNGGYPVTARGICWSAVSSNPTIEDNHTNEVADNGDFTSLMTNLEPNTTYYVRAYATNEVGTSYGMSVIFTTANGLPVISTIFIGENVTETSAITGGRITDDGGYQITERGVCWNTIPYPTIGDNKTSDGTGKGNFSSTINGIDLNGSNTYHVRAYATNQNGTVYGNEITVSKQNLTYKNLPRLEYGGYVYIFYDDMGDMFYDEAVQLVENLVFAGYDDWMLVPVTDHMRYFMVTIEDGWKDMWGEPVVIYTKDNPAPKSDFPCPTYYWVSDPTCFQDDFQATVYCEPSELYDWDTHTSYYGTSASPNCTQASTNRCRVRPVRRDNTQGGGGSQEDIEKTYYIKHPWGTGKDADWAWMKMTKEGNTFTYTGLWGGIGVNINTTAKDVGADWIPAAEIENADKWTIGDQVTFIYNPATKKLSTQ